MSVLLLLSLSESHSEFQTFTTEDIFVTSGRPDLALLLSGAAQGPRFGFEVNVRIRDYIKRGWECNAFFAFSFLFFGVFFC